MSVPWLDAIKFSNLFGVVSNYVRKLILMHFRMEHVVARHVAERRRWVAQMSCTAVSDCNKWLRKIHIALRKKMKGNNDSNPHTHPIRPSNSVPLSISLYLSFVELAMDASQLLPIVSYKCKVARLRSRLFRTQYTKLNLMRFYFGCVGCSLQLFSCF